MSRSSKLAPAGAEQLSIKIESARDFRPRRFPDVLAANWIIIARQPWVGLRVSPRPASIQAAAGVPLREFPRGPGSSALIASVLRVAPNSRPDDHLPMRPRVTPIAAPSSPPPVNLRVAPNLRSVCVAFQPTSGFPRPLRLPALPAGRSSGRPEFRPPGVAANASPDFPGSCVHGWVDDEPGQTRTLHPPAEPRDESSRPNGRSHILPALDAFPTSIRLFTCRTSLPVKRRNETEPASSCRNRTALPIPYRFIN